MKCTEHGDFKITPNDHLGYNKEKIAYGCPKCKNDVRILDPKIEKRLKKSYLKTEWKKRFHEKGQFDWSFDLPPRATLYHVYRWLEQNNNAFKNESYYPFAYDSILRNQTWILLAVVLTGDDNYIPIHDWYFEGKRGDL